LQSIQGQIDLIACSEDKSVRLEIAVDEEDAHAIVRQFCDARGPREIDQIICPATEAFAESIAHGVVTALPKLADSVDEIKHRVLSANAIWCHWFVVHFPHSAVMLEVDKNTTRGEFRLKLEEVPIPRLSDPLESRKRGHWGGP
jgi:hypothetical protein